MDGRRQTYCPAWVFGSAENRGDFCFSAIEQRHPCRDPGMRSELHFPEAAAQTRIVSVARIRLDSRNLSDLSKGIACRDISEFESYHPSQPVWSLWTMSAWQEYPRHFRKLAPHRRVSKAQFSEFTAASGRFRGPVSGREFSISVL
jgi:hypothetical protein